MVLPLWRIYLRRQHNSANVWKNHCVWIVSLWCLKMRPPLGFGTKPTCVLGRRTFLLYKGEVKLVSLALGSVSPTDATLIFLKSWSNYIITAHFLKGERHHKQKGTKHTHLQEVHTVIYLTVSVHTHTVGIFVGAACSSFHQSLHVDYNSRLFGLTVQFAALLSYGKQERSLNDGLRYTTKRSSAY